MNDRSPDNILYDHGTANNMLRALFSLDQVTKLLLSYEQTYNAVIFSRLDLRFMDDLNVNELMSAPEGVLLTPYWQTWRGFNDRLAIAVGSLDAIKVFGNRIRYIGEYLGNGTQMKHSIHAESFLKWVIERDHQRTVEISIRAQRIRATGSVAPNDRCLPLCTPDVSDLCRETRWPCKELRTQGQKDARAKRTRLMDES